MARFSFFERGQPNTTHPSTRVDTPQRQRAIQIYNSPSQGCEYIIVSDSNYIFRYLN